MMVTLEIASIEKIRGVNAVMVLVGVEAALVVMLVVGLE